MSKKQILLDKIENVKSKFDNNEQKILEEFLIEEILKNLFNEKPIENKKVELFYILKSRNEDLFNKKKEELMRYKAIQTRALILDLISTDYNIDVKFIYKPEKWIYKITEDIENSLIKNQELVCLYNKFLIQEFEDIFITKVGKYGSNGNQLLVNFMYYKEFMSKYLDFDFSHFLINIKKQIDPKKLYKDDELEEIVFTKVKS